MFSSTEIVQSYYHIKVLCIYKYKYCRKVQQLADSQTE